MKNLVSKKFLVIVALLLLTVNSAFAQQKGGRVDPAPFQPILDKYWEICARNNATHDQQAINDMKKIAYNPDNAAILISMGSGQLFTYKNHAPKKADMSIVKKVGAAAYNPDRKWYSVSYYYYKYQEKYGGFEVNFRAIKDANGNIVLKII